MRRHTNFQSNYGGSQPRPAQHDGRIQRNFTQDNEDYYPHSAQYNDRQEEFFSREDRLASEHHDRPERRRRYQDPEDHRPSNYSDGGHGRKFIEDRDSYRGGNSDNADYRMNQDYSRGAHHEYEHSDQRHVRAENRERSGRPDNYSERTNPSVPQDDRYRQSDWAPQDRYNEISPDRHREASQDRYYPQINANPTRDFEYHHSTEDHETLEQEPRRRGRHYREY